MDEPMQTTPMDCSECGAALKVSAGSDIVMCEYCGSSHRLLRGSLERVDERTQAEIQEFRDARVEYRKRIEQKIRRTRLVGYIAVGIGLVFIVSGVVALFVWSGNSMNTNPEHAARFPVVALVAFAGLVLLAIAAGTRRSITQLRSQLEP